MCFFNFFIPPVGKIIQANLPKAVHSFENDSKNGLIVECHIGFWGRGLVGEGGGGSVTIMSLSKLSAFYTNSAAVT